MIRTQYSKAQLKEDIQHLHEVSEQGWTLLWGPAATENPAEQAPVECKGFELVYRGNDPAKARALDMLLSTAYKRALKEL